MIILIKILYNIQLHVYIIFLTEHKIILNNSYNKYFNFNFDLIVTLFILYYLGYKYFIVGNKVLKIYFYKVFLYYIMYVLFSLISL